MAATSVSVPLSTASTTPNALTGASPTQNDPTNLYLFTFLATLCLLLLVSSSVTLRALMLRRRIQRQIEEAAFALPGDQAHNRASRRRMRFAEKPKFHNAWVAPGGEHWDTIMPVSAQFICPKNYKKTRHPDRRSPSQPSSRSSFSRFFNAWNTHPGPEPLPAEPTLSDAELGQSKRKRRSSELQVSVLVAMPSPRSDPTTPSKTVDITQAGGWDDDEIMPNVVIGVAHIPYSLSSKAE